MYVSDAIIHCRPDQTGSYRIALIRAAVREVRVIDLPTINFLEMMQRINTEISWGVADPRMSTFLIYIRDLRMFVDDFLIDRYLSLNDALGEVYISLAQTQMRVEC